jgi:hypothetical protein
MLVSWEWRRGQSFSTPSLSARPPNLCPPANCSCTQLAGAAAGGRDAESKGDEGERESKSPGDGDEYLRVRVEHASTLGVYVDPTTNLPRNKQLFVKVCRGAPARGWLGRGTRRAVGFISDV